ncbi:secretion system protein [Saccharothrix sp. AJ9571]|nr:secretion system protein [Saccharothrix sp. AJ9571]
MIPAVLFGAGSGIGLWLVLNWALPRREPLGVRLAGATFQPSPVAIAAPADITWVTAWGRPFIPFLRAVGLPGTKLERDLRLVGRGRDTHLAAKALLAMAGLLTPWLLQASLVLVGGAPSLELPLVAGFALAALGFVVPDVQVRARAARQRRQFRSALSTFLDLVWITLAGGSGVESALLAAAAVGQGPSFGLLRQALQNSQLVRSTPWHNLRQLGEELDIAELSELAASISLAGTEGARVRASLAAKAQALRVHQVTDAEAEAQAATERMALPVTLLFLGFLGFIAYPAVTQVLNGL